MMQKLMILVLFSIGLVIACSEDGSSGSGDGDTGTGISGDTGTGISGDTSNSADSATGTETGNVPDSGSTADTVTSVDSATTAGNDTASHGSDTASGTGGNDTDTVVDTGVTPNDSDTSCRPVMCGGKYYQCADCFDNDSDGLTDAQDPDCLGACDNNESGFNIEVPGGAPSGCTVECYFDADNGTGNDMCDWDYTCDVDAQFVKEPNKYCEFDSEAGAYCAELRTSQATTCNSICEPLVPNGCDCWGCCEIKGAYRYIGTPGCDLQHLDACSPCTPVPSCENPCNECELCIGETTLPDYCLTAIDTDTGDNPADTDSTDNPDDSDTHSEPGDTATTDNPDDTSVGDSDSTEDTEDTPVYLRCPDGRQPCGQIGDQPCTDEYYCLTGCCTQVIVE
jgi:hypothetical protein